MNEIKVDLTNKSIGRAASEVAKIIIGKNKVDYAPNKVNEVQVLIENLDKLKFTGRKLDQKKYYRHSGYLGNLKEKTLEERVQGNPERLFLDVLKGMLPKNRLQSKMLSKVKFVKIAKD